MIANPNLHSDKYFPGHELLGPLNILVAFSNIEPPTKEDGSVL